MTKKEFALQAIASYYKDPSTCGYEHNRCLYITTDGRMCVLGKYLINPEHYVNSPEGGSADTILRADGMGIIKEEYRDILDIDEWQNLQQIHDAIANSSQGFIISDKCDSLGLFTLEELQEAANQLN